MDKVSNSHSQFSEGKQFKISYNFKSKCDHDLFQTCAGFILKELDSFKFFSTAFAWCGKATLKSCDESVNRMRQLFIRFSSNVTDNGFLTCCKMLLYLKIEGSQFFLKTMYTEFPSQMFGKFYASQRKTPKLIIHNKKEMNMETFLSTAVNCGISKSTIGDVTSKIANDNFLTSGGKKMKGGAITFDIDYLFSIFFYVLSF